jgi:hypothetical protein
MGNTVKMAALELRKDRRGRVQARRKDGKPLTVEDRMKALAMVTDQPTEPRAWVIEEVRDQAGRLRAVLICSMLVEDHVWLIIDQTFIPPDDRARYYAEELPALGKKTPAKVVEAHKAKLKTQPAFPGGKIRA